MSTVFQVDMVERGLGRPVSVGIMQAGQLCVQAVNVTQVLSVGLNQFKSVFKASVQP